MMNFHISERLVSIIFFSVLVSAQVSHCQDKPGIRNVLYLNSYAINHPWTDSLVSGVQDIFSKRTDIHLFTEFLDAKHFGQSQFDRLFDLYLSKYKNIRFEMIITSDNDALDFMMTYGDSLAPGVPVIFCGISNPQDYSLDRSRFYGILDGADLKIQINLIMKIMPGVSKLYFIADRSTTGLLNLNYAKKLAQEYAGRIEFKYIHNYSPQNLIEAVGKFEKGSAIALLHYNQDEKGYPVNQEAIYREIAEKSPVPIFMDSESMLGHGIAGGIMNNGVNHARQTAQMAVDFIDNPGNKPASQIILPRVKYFFDYTVLQKFNISTTLLPPGSTVINKPPAISIRQIKFFILPSGILVFLLLVILLLRFSAVKRKKAEFMVTQKLHEIQEKNHLLEQAQRQLNKMNSELAEMNESLSRTNEALIIAKEKSEESDKLKSAFLTNISHEIRTPLNAIIGFSALLNDSELTAEERCEYFGIISSNSEQLLRIIDDVLDLSKIEAGQLKLHLELFSVHDFLNEVSLIYQQAINRNHVQLIVSEPDLRNRLFMRSDRARFKQIFCNLLSNAVKFTQKGFIEIGYSYDNPGEITFYVKDTGVGIDSKEMRHLFNRFWKANMKGEKFYSGAGLGLAISRKLCEALGGKIRVESEHGSGTTFYLTFQDYILKSQTIEHISIADSDKKQFDLTGFTIAIVEDENANMFLLSKMLRGLNCDIISFTSGKEIVNYINQDNHSGIDLILMDIRMPEMDGVMASALVREKYPQIPIIAQTAYATAEDISKIKRSSFDDYISKPIKSTVLLEKIRNFLYPEEAGKRLNH